MTKAHPILFTAEMVRAILDNRKNQTRRVISPQPIIPPDFAPPYISDGCLSCIKRSPDFQGWFWVGDQQGKKIRCPYAVGDLLWVREAWAMDQVFDDKPGSAGNKLCTRWFRADDTCAGPTNCNDTRGRWRSSRFMPRWASRITLRIKDVRVERVQEISETDAEAEGVIGIDSVLGIVIPYRADFRAIWERINGARGFGWSVNPYVWVIEFEVVNAR